MIDNKINKAKKIICLLIFMIIFAVPASAASSRVMITDYYIEGGGFVAGNISTVTFVLKNTSRTANVTSVLLSGWIDSAAPVEFSKSNQAYVEVIGPGEEVIIAIEYYVKNVDMTAINNVSGGFTIHYNDEALNGDDCTNNVSVTLPVLRNARTTVDEDDMKWPTPSVSKLSSLLSSNLMQSAYIAGFVFCVVWIMLLIFLKIGILKRNF